MKRMRKTALFLVMLLVCTLLPIQAPEVKAETNVDEAVLEARTGVLQVISGVKENGSNSVIELLAGSGFLIGTEDAGQYVITNYHVVRKSITKEYADANKLNEKNLKQVISVVALRDMTYSAEIVKYSAECDIAILKMENILYNSNPLILSTKSETIETQDVYALGFPAGAQYGQDVSKVKDEDVTAEKGAISKFSTISGVEYIQHNAQLSNGNSGGPLVNADGQVVGVNTFSKELQGSSANYYYSVKIDIVREMLDALGIQYTSTDGTSGSGGNGSDVDDPAAQTGDDPAETTTEAPVEVVDKGGLEAALSAAKEKEQSDYTKESYEVLDKAIADAESVYENDAATEEDVKAATQALEDAISALKEKSSLPIILIAVVVLVIIGIIVVIIVTSSSKKKKAANNRSQGAASVPPTPPVMPQTPVQPAPAVKPAPMPFVGDGAGETSVLNEGAGETTILSNQNVPQASLFRISNRETIRLNKGNFTIGKERRRVDYCIDNNNSISRNHAMIVVKNGIFYLVDQKSTNGTYLNGVKLNPLQEMELKSGDKIKLSDEEFEFKAF